MPELPEVETVIRDLKAHRLVGSEIRAVTVRWPRMVSNGTPASLASALIGRTLVGVSRRGKYILLTLDNGACLHVHLRMTGKFRFEQKGTSAGPHDHVTLTLGDGRRLLFNDTRKFGRFRLVPKGVDGLAHLGPDAMDKSFTVAVLRQRLSGRRRMIKPLLLDQTILAGLGNIYVDESLWAAGLHPRRHADTLGEDEIHRLFRAIRLVLRQAVSNGGTTLGRGRTNFYSVAGRRGRNAGQLKVFRREGESCFRCGTRIVRAVVGQRGTHVCPACQKG